MFWGYDFDDDDDNSDGDYSYDYDSDNYYVGTRRLVPLELPLGREREDGSRLFQNYGHGRELLAELASQWKTGEFLDVTVQVDGREFPCHRAVLASTPYFKAMLSSNFAESSSRVIQLGEIDSISFSKILDFLYTGEIRINNDNVQDILQTAHMLQFDKILQYCVEVIQHNLCQSNCLGVMRLANMYDLSALKNKARNMVVSNFPDVTQDEEFLSLSVQELADLLGDEDLKVTNEDDVVLSVIKWLDHAPENHQTAIPMILKEIRLSCVRVSVLQKLESHPVIQESAECLAKITAVREKHLLATEVGDASPRCGISDNLAIIVGGWNADWRASTEPIQSIICLDPDSEQYYHITTLPTPVSGHMSVAGAGGHLYVTGGRVHPVVGQGRQPTPSRQAFRYHFPSDTWLRLPDMPRGWAGHQSVVVDGKLFLVYAKRFKEVTMGCYDPKMGAWKDIHVRPPLRPSLKLTVTALGDKVVFIMPEITDADDRPNDVQHRAGIQQSAGEVAPSPALLGLVHSPGSATPPTLARGQGKLCVHAFDVKTKCWRHADIQMNSRYPDESVENVDILATAVNDRLYISILVRTGYTSRSKLYIFDAEENTLTKGKRRDWKEDVLRTQCEYSYDHLRQKVRGIVDTICYHEFGDSIPKRQTSLSLPSFGHSSVRVLKTKKSQRRIGGCRGRELAAQGKEGEREGSRDHYISTRRTPLPYALFGHSFLQTKKSRIGWYCRDLAALGKEREGSDGESIGATSSE